MYFIHCKNPREQFLFTSEIRLIVTFVCIMLPKILGWWWGQREEFIIIICYFPVRQRFRSLFAWSGDKRKPLLTAAWSSIYIVHSIALTHAHCASWHVGQHIRYHVCSGPASEWPSRCDGGSWPGVMEDLELPFYSLTPGVLGSPWFLLPLWCPQQTFWSFI